jgi:NADPH:quinone reductase-like Zn-dependent oxidoreductase
LQDWDLRPPLPRIVGHEGIGEIVELGSNVVDNVKKKVILLVFLGFRKLVFIVNIVCLDVNHSVAIKEIQVLQLMDVLQNIL